MLIISKSMSIQLSTNLSQTSVLYAEYIRLGILTSPLLQDMATACLQTLTCRKN